MEPKVSYNKAVTILTMLGVAAVIGWIIWTW